jgi:hypothetical protein
VVLGYDVETLKGLRARKKRIGVFSSSFFSFFFFPPSFELKQNTTW